MPLVKVVVVALLHAAVGVGDGGCIAAGCAVGASERACVAACCLVVPGEGAVRWVRLREAALLNPARWMQTLMAALMAALLMTLPVLWCWRRCWRCRWCPRLFWPCRATASPPTVGGGGLYGSGRG
jgi:hypothetical protein